MQKLSLIIDPNAAEEFDYQLDRSLRVDITYDLDLGLSENLERKIAAVASSRERPDIICGQRSSLIQLPEPSTIFKGFDLQAIQVKGHFFRPTEESRVIHNPQMTIYTGRGHPEVIWHFDDKGTLILIPNPDIPCGAMLLENAKLEFRAAKEMMEVGLPVVCPMGYGNFPDLGFNVYDSIMAATPGTLSGFAIQAGAYGDLAAINRRQEVGFMVYGIYTPDNCRCFESVLNVTSELDKSNKRLFLADFFRAYGAALRQFHDKGYIHGSPNLDNLSLVPVSEARRGMKLPNKLQTFSVYEIVFHDLTGDLGTITRRKDVSKEKWLSHVIWDLSVTTGLLSNFYFTPERWDMVYGHDGEARRNIIRRNQRIAELTQEVGYNPGPAFFKGYLGEDFHKLPSDYFEHDGSMLMPCDIRTRITIPLQLAMNRGEKPQVNIPEFCKTEPLMNVVRNVYMQ